MLKRLIFKDKKSLFSFGFLFLLILTGVLIPLFSNIDPNYFDPNLAGSPKPPSLTHLFGTDNLGRDLVIRSIFGARISLAVAFVSVMISISIGILYGLTAGYLGGRTDEFLMRVVDLFMAIPTIFLILTIQILLTPSIWNVVIVIGITSWMGVARLVRAEVLSVKERPFILAAKARGISTTPIIIKHIFPHTLAPIIVAATLGMGGAILTESVLSYLGLGVQPPHASWGNMLDNSLAYMSDAPWMSIVPGIFITLTVLALNFIGDSLRAIFNPKETYA